MQDKVKLNKTSFHTRNISCHLRFGTTSYDKAITGTKLGSHSSLMVLGCSCPNLGLICLFTKEKGTFLLSQLRK